MLYWIRVSFLILWGILLSVDGDLRLLLLLSESGWFTKLIFLMPIYLSQTMPNFLVNCQLASPQDMSTSFTIYTIHYYKSRDAIPTNMLNILCVSVGVQLDSYKVKNWTMNHIIEIGLVQFIFFVQSMV